MLYNYPANAIGDLICRLLDFDLPQDPRTTLTVARLAGGTSINAIPAESWVELDVRSEANETLQAMEGLTPAQIREALLAYKGLHPGEAAAIPVQPVGEV